MKRPRKFNLERELRSHAPEPRADFVQSLAGDVRDQIHERRSPWRHGGLALALTGLMLVAIASFGGAGYAASVAHQAVTKVVRVHKSHHTASAAQAQYGPVTPPTTVKKPATQSGVAGGAVGVGTAPAKTVQTTTSAPAGKLPFTGLSLWVPLAGGIALIAFGLVLRTRARVRKAEA